MEHTQPRPDKPRDFIPPISFCVAAESKIRLGHQNEQVVDSKAQVWEQLESYWIASREKGKGKLEQPHAKVGGEQGPPSLFRGSRCHLFPIFSEPFWVNLMVFNPIEANVELRNFTLTLNDTHEASPDHSQLARCEVLDEIQLHPDERRIVCAFYALMLLYLSSILFRSQ